MRVVVALLLSTLAGAAFANTITVTTTADVIANDGLCSLREAIIAANSNAGVSGCSGGSGSDTIMLPGGTFVFAIGGVTGDAGAGDLDISEAVTIAGASPPGPSGTTIDAAGLDRIFDIDAPGRVRLQDLLLTGGAIAATGEQGGAVRALTALTIERCVVLNNYSAGGGGGVGSLSDTLLTIVDSSVVQNRAGVCGDDLGDGGGVYMQGGDIRRSTFFENRTGGPSGCTGTSGGFGGAVAISGGITRVDDSAFSANVAGAGGGALFLHGAPSHHVDVSSSSFYGNSLVVPGSGSAILADISGGASVENSTISNNTNGTALALFTGRVAHSTVVGNVGGGLENLAGNVSMGSSIVSSNQTLTMMPGADFSGNLITSGGHNLVATSHDGFEPAHSELFADNVLGSAIAIAASTDATNGTQFHAPLSGSIVVDAGNCEVFGGLATRDQRGLARTCRCDIGAVEVQKPSVRITEVAMSAACGNGPATRVEAIDCAGNVLELQDICAGGGGIVGPAGANGTTGPTGGVGAAGAQGQPGEVGRNGTKIKTEKLATGDEACREGGIRITVGDDANADGTLTGTEISDSQTLCNPPQPSSGCGSTNAAPFAMIAALFLLRRRRRA